MSRKAALKGRAVLEGVGLHTHTVDACFSNYPLDEEGAVQEGLSKWSDGQGRQPPTWQVLLEAMDYAEIAQKHVNGLKGKLGLLGMLFTLVKQCMVGACVCVHAMTACVCLRACECAYVHACLCVCASVSAYLPLSWSEANCPSTMMMCSMQSDIVLPEVPIQLVWCSSPSIHQRSFTCTLFLYRTYISPV